MSEPIEFYLEFVSPFAYIAAKETEIVAAKHGREVIWRPIAFGHLCKALGIERPASIPQKLKYILMDSTRSAAMSGISITKPAVFPVDAKLARLAFYALNKSDKELAKKFAAGVFEVFWVKGMEITEPAHLENLASSLDLDADFLVNAAQDQDAKVDMIAATNSAVDSDAFGVPWFKIGDQVFWGADRVSHIDKYLENQASSG